MLEINRGGVVGSLSVGWKGGNRPNTPGHWRVGVPGKKEGGRGADGGTEVGVGGGGPGGPGRADTGGAPAGKQKGPGREKGGKRWREGRTL